MNFIEKLYLSAAVLTLSPLAFAAGDGTDKAAENLDEVGKFVVKVKGSSDWTDNMVPIAVFIMVIVLVFIKHRSKIAIARARVDAIKILAEKGQTVPEGMLKEMDAPSSNGLKKSPLSRAITHLSLGAGFLAYFLVNSPHRHAWALGVGFIVMGLGNLWIAKNNRT